MTAALLGVADSSWVIEQVSVDPHELLACPAEELIGQSLLDHVHPGDIPSLRSAVDLAVARRADVELVLQVGRPTRWSPARIVVSPMLTGSLGFCVLRADTDPLRRATDLEHRLWRIAREIDAAGVTLSTEHRVDLSALPGAESLSARQREILRRLLDGERVPSIASSLFLSPSTVRNHLTAIFAKAGVHSQSELIDLVRSSSPPGLVGTGDAAA